MPAPQHLLACAIGAFAASWMIVVMCRLAGTCGMVDRPGGRKRHVGEVPLIGGIAIWFGVMAAVPALDAPTRFVTLTQAIGRAGGLSPVTANADELYVIRGSRQLSTTPAEVFHLPARSPAAFALADGFRMEPGDVVFVGAAGVTKWNRVLSQLLPLSGFIYNASRVETDN